MKNTRRRKILKIGVTGGIGSGKSELCRLFEAEGIPVFYADTVAKNLVDSSAEIQARIRRVFGSKSIGEKGTPNRTKLAEVVFADRGMREKLNAIVHPDVLRAFRDFVRRNSSENTAPFLIAEAALIFESRMNEKLDYVIVIDAPEDVRIRRVQRRDAVSREDVKRRITSQMPVGKKLVRADFIVKNDGTVTDLKKAVDFFINLFRFMS
ncbi:MAG: dephospho-CoA kinase [Bacteroidota bacterium]